MTDDENSTDDLDPLLEVSLLASRLMRRYEADPSEETARRVATVLYALADRKHNRLSDWYEKTKALARKDRTHIGPVVDKSNEADVLCRRLWILMSCHTGPEEDDKRPWSEQIDGRRALTVHEIIDRADDIARSALRTLRTLPMLCAETRLPSHGPLSTIDEHVDTVANIIRRRAEAGRLDPELMVIAIMKALGCNPSTAKNLFKHKG